MKKIKRLSLLLAVILLSVIAFTVTASAYSPKVTIPSSCVAGKTSAGKYYVNFNASQSGFDSFGGYHWRVSFDGGDTYTTASSSTGAGLYYVIPDEYLTSEIVIMAQGDELGCGFVNSNECIVTIPKIQPEITKQPSKIYYSTTEVSGGNVTIYAGINTNETFQKYTYTWYIVNGSTRLTLTNTARATDNITGNSSRIVADVPLSMVQDSDSYVICKIDNGEKTVSTKKLYFSETTVKFKQQPANVILTGDEYDSSEKTFTVNNSCIAAGSGVSYQWQYSLNGGTTWDVFTGKTSSGFSCAWHQSYFYGSSYGNCALRCWIVMNNTAYRASSAGKVTACPIYTEDLPSTLTVAKSNLTWIKSSSTSTYNDLGVYKTHISVSATGYGDISYVWYYSTDSEHASWYYFPATTYSGNTLNYIPSSVLSEGNVKIACLATDAKKNSSWCTNCTPVLSNIEAKVNAIPTLTQSNVSGQCFNISASLTTNGLSDPTYKWQYKIASGKWTDCNSVGSTASPSMMFSTASVYKGLQLRCVISSHKGTVQLETPGVTVNAAPMFTTGLPSVVKAPKVADETYYYFDEPLKVTATGSGTLYYLWYYRANSSADWVQKTAYTTNTGFTNFHKNLFASGEVKCRVVDSNGNYSETTAKLYAVPAPTITTNLPFTYYYDLEDEISKDSYGSYIASGHTFKVVATGDDVTYKWYVSKDNEKTWTLAGSGTEYTPSVNLENINYPNSLAIKCDAIASDTTVTSSRSCYLYIEPFFVNSTPSVWKIDPALRNGNKATLTIQNKYFEVYSSKKITGYGICWVSGTGTITTEAATKASTSAKATFVSEFTGYTAEVDFPAYSNRYRLFVYDTNGVIAISNNDFTIAQGAVTPQITVPQTTVISVSEKCTSGTFAGNYSVTFDSNPTGTSPEYQWYYRIKGSSVWIKATNDSGTKADCTLLFTEKQCVNGIEYKCVMFADSTVLAESEIGFAGLALQYTGLPKVTSACTGDDVSFTVTPYVCYCTATYRWQISDDGKTWTNLENSPSGTTKDIISGATATTLKLSNVDKFIGKYFRVVGTSPLTPENKTPAVQLKSKHVAGVATKENVLKATCTREASYKNVVRCTLCNAIISSEKVVTSPKLGHKLTKSAYVAATCTSTGHYTYYTCSTCGKVYVDSAGTHLTTVKEQTIKMKAHKITYVSAKAATCTTAGNIAHYKCTVCSKVFTDSNGANETTVKAVTLKAKSHYWSSPKVTKAATCTKTGVKTYTCTRKGCTATKTATIPAKGHTITKVAYKAATCTATGHYTYYKCTTCSKVYVDSAATHITTVKEQTIAKKAHKVTKVAYKAATCTSTGHYTYYKCSTCGKVFVDSAATKITTVKEQTIAMKSHKIVYVSYKAPTATTDGNKTHYKCTLCGKLFKDSKGVTELTAADVTIKATGK